MGRAPDLENIMFKKILYSISTGMENKPDYLSSTYT